MQRQTIIVLICGDQVETWGNLKEACNAHEWSYNTISRKNLPIEWKGWKIYRCRFKALFQSNP